MRSPLSERVSALLNISFTLFGDMSCAIPLTISPNSSKFKTPSPLVSAETKSSSHFLRLFAKPCAQLRIIRFIATSTSTFPSNFTASKSSVKQVALSLEMIFIKFEAALIRSFNGIELCPSENSSNGGFPLNIFDS